jgi:hypothetical protein
LNLGPPSTQTATLQQSKLGKKQEESGSTRRTFYYNMTTLGLTPCKPPWKQSRVVYHHLTTFTVQSRIGVIFSKYEERLSWTLYHSNKEVERNVSTWMKKQCHDGLEKHGLCWWKCMENGGYYVLK